MADALARDVQALKQWLRTAWSRLANPSMTLFERQELRNAMKEAEVALRAGVEKLAARDMARVNYLTTLNRR